MEELASNRDRVLHACAAGDPKLLPKYKKPAGSGVAAMQSVVNRLVSKGEY